MILLDFQQLFLRPHTVLRTRSVEVSVMPLLAARQEVAKKRAKAFPLGFPLALPLYKAHQEIDITIFYVVLQILPPRAAGGDRKSFLLTEPILGVRLCAQDGESLQKQKPRRLSKSRRDIGVPRGSPWSVFLVRSLSDDKE